VRAGRCAALVAAQLHAGPPLACRCPTPAAQRRRPLLTAPLPPAHARRCIVCYFGHHYQAFALSEELGQWLLFDDKRIEVIGGWREVRDAMVANRMQPSVLFYEAQQEA
jgi:hypothetical protein